MLNLLLLLILIILVVFAVKVHDQYLLENEIKKDYESSTDHCLCCGRKILPIAKYHSYLCPLCDYVAGSQENSIRRKLSE